MGKPTTSGNGTVVLGDADLEPQKPPAATASPPPYRPGSDDRTLALSEAAAPAAPFRYDRDRTLVLPETPPPAAARADRDRTLVLPEVPPPTGTRSGVASPPAKPSTSAAQGSTVTLDAEMLEPGGSALPFRAAPSSAPPLSSPPPAPSRSKAAQSTGTVLLSLAEEDLTDMLPATPFGASHVASPRPIEPPGPALSPPPPIEAVRPLPVAPLPVAAAAPPPAIREIAAAPPAPRTPPPAPKPAPAPAPPAASAELKKSIYGWFGRKK